MVLETVKEWRVGRNFIRVGDVVKVTPSSPGKRDGFEAVVEEIAMENGTVHHFKVTGGCRGRWHVRHIRPERIKRVAQVRSDGAGQVTKRERRR